MKKSELNERLKEVEARLISLPAAEKPSMWKAENYVGGGQSKRRYLDLKLPQVRDTYRMGFSFSDWEPERQIKVWHHIWNESNIFEVMLIPSFYLHKLSREDFQKYAPLFLEWVERVDNWAHSDEMSHHYSQLLEADPKKYLPVFERWSKSKNPWLRRQSVVGLLFYSRFRKKVPPFKTLEKFISRQMHDEHYYVQKGVGWALREAYNVYPKETFAYLKRNAANIPPAGWTAATEKLPKDKKATLTKLRKAR